MTSWAERLLGVTNRAEVPDLEELADEVEEAEDFDLDEQTARGLIHRLDAEIDARMVLAGVLERRLRKPKRSNPKADRNGRDAGRTSFAR